MNPIVTTPVDEVKSQGTQGVTRNDWRQTMKSILFIGTILLSTLLCGCKLHFKDVSGEPECAPLLNNRYSLSAKIYFFGITLPPGYGDDINIYTLRPVELGGISGPEILSEDILNPGTILEIQSIKKSINHIPGFQSVDAVVSVIPFEKTADVPITISLRYIQSTHWMNKL